MPPRLYVITAIVLAVILFGSRLYPFYWLFATTAGVLTIVGVIRIGRGLRGPPWVGIGFAIPAMFWTAHALYDVYSRPVLPEPVVPGLEGILANTIAGAAALYLLELITGRRTVFWLGYAILAGAALCSGVSLIGLFPGHGINFWFAFDSAYYTFISRPLTLLGAVLPYLAYISLAIVVSLQRRLEIWVSVVVAAVGLFLIYKVGDLVLWIPMEGQHDGLIGWPEPVIMFVGAVAVWRLGALLSAQPTTDAAIATSSAIAPPASPITAEPNKGPQQQSSPIPQNANVTREPALSNKNGDWGPIISRVLLIYFSVLAALTLAAMVDASTLFGVLLHIFLGPILFVPPTLLYYSTALLPAYFINRLLQRRLLAGAAAAVCLVLAGALPHYIGEHLSDRLVAADHTDPTTIPSPRSFVLPFPNDYDYWSNNSRWHERDLNRPTPPCEDLCQQLLFKGNADYVLVKSYPDSFAAGVQNGTIVVKPGRAFALDPGGLVRELKPVASAPSLQAFVATKWWRFHLEDRETCPDTLTLIEAAFVRDVLGGRCLVEDAIDSPYADVTLSIVDSRRRTEPSRDTAAIGVQQGPTTVTIMERRGDRSVPAEVKTTLVANLPTLPFTFASRPCESSFSCLAIATEPFPKSSAEPFDMLDRRYGLTIQPTPWKDRFALAVSEDDRATVNAIIDHDYGAATLIPMTTSVLVADFVSARIKSGKLSQDDIDLIHSLLKQHAFTSSVDFNGPQPATAQVLKPLLPEIIDRIALRYDGLTESLVHLLPLFSPQDVAPYLPTLCAKDGNVPRLDCRRLQNAHQ
jgi:hypothetical protein